MSMDEQEWLKLKRQDAAREQGRNPLARLQAERANAVRNIEGWQRQVERIRRNGREPTAGLVALIEATEREVRRLDAEILRVQRIDYDERQRTARSRYGNQARRVGEALPNKGKE